MFSTLPKTNFNFSVTFILSSASDFNLDRSKNLTFGKGLNFADEGVSDLGICLLECGKNGKKKEIAGYQQFSCSHIERSGAYCFTVVRPSVCCPARVAQW